MFKLSKYQDHPLIKAYNATSPLSFYLLWAIITFGFTHTGTYFVVLSFRQCLRIIQSLYFMPLIVLIFSILATQFILKEAQKK